MRHSFRAALTVIVLTGCAATAADPALTQKDKDAIQSTVDKYVKAAIAGDWDTWGSTLATDVYYSPVNLAPMTSRAATVTWAKSFPKITALTVTNGPLTGVGDDAYAHGTYTLDVQMPDGAKATEHGSFLNVWHRQADGSWLYSEVMYHSNDPAPPPAPAVKSK